MAARQVRAAAPADAEAIALVHWTCWRQTYAGLVAKERLGQAALERRRRQWRDQLGRARSADEVITVGLVDGEVVGWASGALAVAGDRPVAHLPRAGEEVVASVGPGADPGPAAAAVPAAREVQGLYLLREHHGGGLGQELLDSVLSPGPAFVWVARENPRARAFYRRNGFVADGVSVVEEHLGGLVSIRMVRHLP